MKLVRHTTWTYDQAAPPAQALRHTAIETRALWAAAKQWPELATADRVTGTYHAIGEEKHAVMRPGLEIVRVHGFDPIKPAATIFEYSAFGRFAALAVALDCRGPFYALEANGFAAAYALSQAAADLDDGACDQALVGGAVPGLGAFLWLFDRGEPGLRVRCVHAGKSRSVEAIVAETSETWQRPLARREVTLGADDPLGAGAVLSALTSQRPTALVLRGRRTLVCAVA